MLLDDKLSNFLALSLVSFWDPYNANIIPLDVLPEVP